VEKSNLKVGVVGGLGAATISLGVQQNIFSRAGLTVSLQTEPSDAQAEKDLQSGAIDVAFGDYSEFLDTSAKPSVAGQIQVIGEGYDAGENTIGLVAAKGSGLRNDPLTGGSGSLSYRIANAQSSVDVPTTDSPEYVALANWAIGEQNPLGLNLTTIHGIQTLTPPLDGAATAAAMEKDVTTGARDTAVLQEPYLTQALETGNVIELANLDTGNADNMPIAGYFALTSMTQKDPNTIAAFQGALSDAQALGSSRVGVESALTSAGMPLTHEVAATTAIGNYPAGLVAANISNALTLMGAADIQTTNLSATSLTGGGGGSF
jgi:NitT/TauT family transport system substrate-binding protein